MSEAKSNNVRCRNFATVVYPESAPENWKDIVSSQCVAGFISPLHCDDVNPTGEKKKEHYHVMYMFEGKKSVAQVEKLFSEFGGVGCIQVNSARSMARYMCHLDNPDKAQYEVDKVTCFGGSDYMSLIGTSSDKNKSIDEMCEFCDKYDVNSFYLLSKYAAAHRSDWSRVLKETSAVYMREWLKSRQWSKENDELHIYDKKSGEILI